MKRYASAFTLVELLVVMSIIAILVALLLPAIQHAREVARISTCNNRLHGLAIGMLSYEAAQQELPPAIIRPKTKRWQTVERRNDQFSWMPLILPYLEGGDAVDRLDLEKRWDDPVNQPVVSLPFNFLVCPSVGIPASDREYLLGSGAEVQRYGVSDYTTVGSLAINSNSNLFGGKRGSDAWQWSEREVRYIPKSKRSAIIETDPTRMSKISDGTSRTLLLIEDADRPNFWTLFGPYAREVYGNAYCTAPRPWYSSSQGKMVLTGGGWSEPDLHAPVSGAHLNGDTVYCGPSSDLSAPAFNLTNNDEGFSFHPGGMIVAFVDGHNEFLNEEMSLRAYVAIVTREAGEISPLDQE